MKEKGNYLKRELYELAKVDDSLFEFITNFALDGLWFWDLENPEQEYFNDQFWLTLGYDPKEMPHRSSAWQGMIDPKDADLAEKLVGEHIQDPSKPYRQLIRYYHRAGHDVWIRCIGKVIFDQGKPIRMLGVHIDVSDEIKATADLKNYFEEVKDLVLIADNEGRISSANSLWQNYLGEDSDLIGQDLFEIIKKMGLRAEEDIESSIQFENRLSWQSGSIRDLGGKEHFFDVSLIFSDRRYFLVAHEISERRAMLKVVERKQSLLDLLLTLSSKFIDVAPETIDGLIKESLESVGEFVQADRAYIFDYDFKASTTSNTYEWCSSGIEPQIENLQQVPMEAFPDWLEYHLRAEAMIIPKVEELPESSLREILSSQSIKSLVAVPVMVNNSCQGFVGFDWVENEVEATYEELQVLEVLANMLSHVGLRKEQDTRLLLEHAINKNIIEHIGYPLIVIDTDTKEHVLVNESFEKMIGYKLKDLQAFEEPFPYWPVEEAQQQKFHALYKGAIKELSAEIISKRGRIIPIRISNHPVFAETVKTPLIILGVEDLSEQKAFIEQIEKEQSFNQELLERSPLYFISINKDFNFLKLNQAAQNILAEIEISTDQGQGFLGYLSKHSKDKISEQEILHWVLKRQDGVLKIISRFPEIENRFIEWTLSLSPHKEEQDEILIFGQDVSERENFILELERSRHQLKAAQELAVVGSFNLNLKTQSLETSDSLKTIIPLELKAKMGLGLETLPNSRFSEAWPTMWKQQLREKGALKFGDWIKLGNSEKYLEFRLHSPDKKGKEIEQVFGTIQDLSDIKRQEQELQDTRDKLIHKSNLLANILQISRYISNENLDWPEVIRKSFELLIKDINADIVFYLQVNELDPDRSFGWKMLYHQSQEVNDAQQMARLNSLKFGSSQKHKQMLADLKEKGYLILDSDEYSVPFTELRMHFEYSFKKMTLFPLVYNEEVQFIWGFIERDQEPWDQELFDTLLKLANDFSRSYGLRQAYLSNQENIKSYELISDATGAAIWQLNLPKKTFTRGPGYKELLGYEQETIPLDQKGLINRVVKIDRADFEKVMQDMMTGRIENWQGTVRIIHAAGHIVNILASISAVKDKKGKVVSLLGSFSESPDFLKDSSLLEKAASVTRLAAWELDTNEPSIRYTDYLKDLLNLPADYKIDFKHLEDLNEIKVLIDQEWMPSPEAVFQELEAHPEGLLRDYHFKFPGDRPDKWLRVKSFPISEEKADHGNYMGVIQDITESVLDKQQITEASQWLEKAQRVGQLGYFLLEQRENQLEWRVSEVLGDLLEIEPDLENPFTEWLDLLVEKYRENMKASIELAFESGQSILKRCEVYTSKTQRRLWIEISGEVQAKESNSDRMMLGTVRNITDTMENLRNMDEQNKRLREIAWAQSHLVRAPLTRMHGLLDEINTGKLSDKERGLFFNHFKESIGELDNIVKDVIKKAQVLEEDGMFSHGFTGNFAKLKDIEVHMVDDDPIIRTLQERVVLKSGLVDNIWAYQSGKDFLEYIDSGFNPDHLILVLLDLNMPDLNGWDVLDRIKSLDLEEQIIVVVTTSSTDNADLKSSYKYSSVIEYIEKPLNYSKMSRIMSLAPIKEVLKNKKTAKKS